MEKTKITHIKRGVPFLGHLFGRKVVHTRQKIGGKVVRRCLTILTLDVDTKKVIQRLKDAGFCDGSGRPVPYFKFLRHPQFDTNFHANQIIRGFDSWFSLAGNRRQATALVAYIVRYSVAKMYSAKFKMKTVARVFKLGGNDLSKPLGAKAKSVVGVSDTMVTKWASEASGKTVHRKIPGILFDRYWKIPRPKPNKILKGWEPKYLELIRKNKKPEEFANYLLNMPNAPGSFFGNI